MHFDLGNKYLSSESFFGQCFSIQSISLTTLGGDTSFESLHRERSHTPSHSLPHTPPPSHPHTPSPHSSPLTPSHSLPHILPPHTLTLPPLTPPTLPLPPSHSLTLTPPTPPPTLPPSLGVRELQTDDIEDVSPRRLCLVVLSPLPHLHAEVVLTRHVNHIQLPHRACCHRNKQ